MTHPPIDPRIDPTLSRQRITVLLEQFPGASPATIAGAAGIDKATVRSILHGRTDRVLASTERAILAITDRKMRREQALVPVGRAIQLVQSMRAQGWSGSYLAARLGQPSRSMPTFVVAPCKHITIALNQRVIDLAREIGDQEGPSRSARLRARAAGWHPLINYDAQGRLIPTSIPTTTAPSSVGTVTPIRPEDQPFIPGMRHSGPVSARLPLRWLVLRSITVDGMSRTTAEELHHTTVPAKMWRQLGIELVPYSRRGEDRDLPPRPVPGSRAAWAVLRRACQDIPADDWVAVLDRPLLFDDIADGWDAPAAWDTLIEEITALNGARERTVLSA